MVLMPASSTPTPDPARAEGPRNRSFDPGAVVDGAGQLGDGTNADRSIPVTVQNLTGAISVSTGTDHTCALLSAGTVKCWGYNSRGQLGDGTTTTRFSPVTVLYLSQVTAIEIGDDHTCAIAAAGSVMCWGSNFFGALGDGSTTNRTRAVQVQGAGRGDRDRRRHLPLGRGAS